MENNFEKLHLQTQLNKKNWRDKFIKDHIFQDLTINNNHKEEDIQTKIKNIKSEEINDLKLIDIRFIHRNFFSFHNFENISKPPNMIKTFSNIKSQKKYKKEIKIFPYISFPQKKFKSNNINNDEKKLFMTKIENMKNFKSNYITYSHNLLNSSNNKKKFDDKNENKINKIFNLTFNKNKSNKRTKKLNYINDKDICYDNSRFNRIFDNKKYKINSIESRSFSKFNAIENKNKTLKDVEEEDYLIFKLLKKNQKLSDYIDSKMKINKKKKFAHSLIFSQLNKRKNNTFSEQSNQLIDEKKRKENDFTPKKINKYYTSQINLTDQKNYGEKSQKLNLLLLNNKNYDNNDNIKTININSKENLNLSNSKKNNYIKSNKNKNEINNLINDAINLIQETKFNYKLLKDIKNKDKLKRLIYFLKINNLEQNLDKDFQNTNNRFKITNSNISKMKQKCKDILEDFDKRINFNLDEFIKDYEKKDLQIDFSHFFNYLLILLMNYDKKIIPNTLEIKKESKTFAEDVKYSKVLEKHNEFMDLLDKQFNEGKNADKLLTKYLLKRKEEIEINNQNRNNKKFIFKK